MIGRQFLSSKGSFFVFFFFWYQGDDSLPLRDGKFTDKGTVIQALDQRARNIVPKVKIKLSGLTIGKPPVFYYVEKF